jgi:hypothetical protein
MRGWQGQPCKMVEYEHRHKTKRNIRSLGCGLQFGGAENDLLAIRLQSSKTFFSAARTREQFEVLSALFSPKMRCACHFILNEAVRNSALALH